jgi:hypothetical protein
MFLIKQEKYNPYIILESIIDFNEEYNTLKENISLQEHYQLTNNEKYLEESLVDNIKAIWESIKRFLIKIKNSIVSAFNFIIKKILQVVSWFSSRFSKADEVIVIPVDEDLQLLDMLESVKQRVNNAKTKEELQRAREVINLLPEFFSSAKKVIREKQPPVVEKTGLVRGMINGVINKLRVFGGGHNTSKVLSEVGRDDERVQLVKQKAHILAQLEHYSVSLSVDITSKLLKTHNIPGKEMKLKTESIEYFNEELTREKIKEIRNQTIKDSTVGDIKAPYEVANNIVKSSLDLKHAIVNKDTEELKSSAKEIGKNGVKGYFAFGYAGKLLATAAMAPIDGGISLGTTIAGGVGLNLGLRSAPEFLDYIDGKTSNDKLKSYIQKIKSML